MRFALVVLSTALVGIAGSAEAASTCKGWGGEPVVAQCKTVRGRVDFADGDGAFTLWPVGTKRIMTIAGPPPPNVNALIRPNSISYLMGNFEVCPLVKDRPGVSQRVCIARGSHLVVVPVKGSLSPAHRP